MGGNGANLTEIWWEEAPSGENNKETNVTGLERTREEHTEMDLSSH